MRDRCGAKTRSGTPCKSYGMENGRCRMHGGTNPGAPIKHGRYSAKLRLSLQDKMSRYRADPEPANLLDELALLRALLQGVLDKLSGPIGEKTRRFIFDMTESIGKMVERIARIINQTALTTAEVEFLQKRYVDLMIRYIPDDRVADFWQEFEASFGVFERSGRALAASAAVDTETADVA